MIITQYRDGGTISIFLSLRYDFKQKYQKKHECEICISLEDEWWIGYPNKYGSINISNDIELINWAKGVIEEETNTMLYLAEKIKKA